MRNHLIVSGIVALLLPVSAAALAQSAGQYNCEQDVSRLADLYRERQAVLTDAERQEAQQLLQVARSKCSSTGQNALNTRSQEAQALLDKLQNAPPPSQAATPPAR